ncbi:propanediol utilization protein [Suicoccus acidiformans]|uniref:Phosphate propanoyltransferase n=1 Tax=Suicoccus acidiformans TaxID=2036206 RepID=A0A347WLY5_9LACT|nr:PduL/EutD family phosphate acyltransferase [Suicoccus acidiformans]AXY26092.1 propanediol utilization protein [Suicoccus acidiformans]
MIDIVVRKVQERLAQTFDIEVSDSYVHLTQESLDLLFGEGHHLSPYKYLSERGTFLSYNHVSLVSPDGVLNKIPVIGPARTYNEVVISQSQALELNLEVPIRLNGEVEESPGILVVGSAGEIYLEQGVISAQRHLSVKSKDAEKLKVHDGQRVSVCVEGARSLVFKDVLCKVSENYNTIFHIDVDEGHACAYRPGVQAFIIERGKLND